MLSEFAEPLEVLGGLDVGQVSVLLLLAHLLTLVPREPLRQHAITVVSVTLPA